MKFFIVLRHTEEWDKLNTTSYFAQRRPHHTGDPEHAALIKKNIEYWDTLDINFYEYRHRIQQLVFDTWNIECLAMHEALHIRDPDVIFIPMDDDDILHPNIVDILTPIFKYGVETASWNTWVYSTLTCGPMFIREHEHVFNPAWLGSLLPSNCYAMRSTVANEALLTYHNKFSWIKHLSRFHTPQQLGISYTHPGSTWLMQRIDITLPDSVYQELPIIPTELKWAENFITTAGELTRSIFKKIEKRA